MCHANQIQVQNMLIHFQLDGKNISSMLFPFLCEIIVPAKNGIPTGRACLTNTTPIHPLSPPVCRQTSSSFSVEPFNNTITLLCVASSSKTVDWWLSSNQGKPAAEIPSIQSYGHHPQVLDPVILSADNAIQWINCFPADERNILPLLTGESVSSG